MNKARDLVPWADPEADQFPEPDSHEESEKDCVFNDDAP